jgi:hypothetical protein
MDLTSHVERLTQALASAATAGGEDAQEFLDRFVAPLEAAIQLSMLNVLSAAADEITDAMVTGSVEVRLRSGNPEFVVTPDADGKSGRDVTDDSTVRELPVLAPALLADDGATLRVSLRLPERLKTTVEEIAGRNGLSLNAWLVRAAATAAEWEDRRGSGGRRGMQVGQNVTGWIR